MNISALIRLMRPHQYIKNLFIFVPLFFAAKLNDTALLLQTALAFVAFSLSASAVYIFNDYRDIEDDKAHPRKRLRPLASGAVSKPQALVTMAVLFVLGALLMAWVNLAACGILMLYVALNIAYSLRLKHIAILDVTVVALGFVLRLFVGAFAAGIDLSQWIVLMTFLLALFMALAKRRDDVLIYEETGQKMRKVIGGYNLRFVDTAMAIMASVVLVAYIIYTASDTAFAHLHSRYLYITSLFVILGILRYLQITFVFEDSGSPTKIVLKDRFMQAVLMGWIISFAWILYL